MLVALTDWVPPTNGVSGRPSAYPPMTMRLFRLLDDQGAGFVGFREFAVAVGIMTRGDVADKMRLLYEIHLDLEDEMKAVGVVSDEGSGGASPTKSDHTEVAEEAIEEADEGLELDEESNFSGTVEADAPEQSIDDDIVKSLEETYPSLATLCAGDRELEIPEIVILKPNSENPEKQQSSEAPAHVFKDPEEYRTRRRKTRSTKGSSICSPASLHSLPSLGQQNFIALLKTLYDLTGEAGDEEDSNEINGPTSQVLFAAISKVGTVLLQIGDMGKKLKEENSGFVTTEVEENVNEVPRGRVTLDNESSVKDSAMANATESNSPQAVDNVESNNGNLRMIGDWYRDELEVAKMSSCANKSLNKLVETKKEGEISDTLLLLTTTDDIGSLTLDGAAVGAPTTTTNKNAPNLRSNDIHLNDSGNRDEDNNDNNDSSLAAELGGDENGTWSVTFEQILASVLADQHLAKFFERETDLALKMERFQSRKVTESYSSFQNFGTTPP